MVLGGFNSDNCNANLELIFFNPDTGDETTCRLINVTLGRARKLCNRFSELLLEGRVTIWRRGLPRTTYILRRGSGTWISYASNYIQFGDSCQWVGDRNDLHVR